MCIAHRSTTKKRCQNETGYRRRRPGSVAQDARNPDGVWVAWRAGLPPVRRNQGMTANWGHSVSDRAALQIDGLMNRGRQKLELRQSMCPPKRGSSISPLSGPIAEELR